jgi:hypothetical protein
VLVNFVVCSLPCMGSSLSVCLSAKDEAREAEDPGMFF